MSTSKELTTGSSSKIAELGPSAEDFYSHRLNAGQIKRGIELVDDLGNDIIIFLLYY
jgi:hypothetical protein